MAGVALENWKEMIRDPKIECMSRDEMTALQSERLVKQVKNVYEHVEFYRKKMDEMGVEPGDIKGIEDIGKLPFTTKEDLRDHYPFGLLAVPQEKIVRVQGTSGTTGKLTLASYTQKDVEVWGECVARGLAMAGLTISEDRLEKVDFCTPYFTANQVVIAKNGSEIANATTTEELLTLLENKKIGFQNGTVAEYFVEGDEGWGFEGIAGAEALGYNSGSLAVQALLSDGLDCVIIDLIPAQRLVEGHTELTVLSEMPLTEEEYAFAIQKGDTALQTAVNNALQQLMDEGTFDEIVDKYYGE